MMNHTIQSPIRKLKLLFILPVFAGIFYAFATPEYQYNSITEIPISDTLDTKILVGNINWEGNTIFSPEELNKAFGLKPGETYSIRLIKQRFIVDVHRLYQDKGYFSSNLEVIESPGKNGTTDITIKASEGEQSKIGQIEITGNNKVSKDDILKVLKIKSGDPYDKDKISQYYQALNETEMFAKLDVRAELITKSAPFKPVDITINVVEKDEEPLYIDSPLFQKIIKNQ